MIWPGTTGASTSTARERSLADQTNAGFPGRSVEQLDDIVHEPAMVLAVAGRDAPKRSERRGYRQTITHVCSRRSMPNSMESTRASQLASMMF